MRAVEVSYGAPYSLPLFVHSNGDSIREGRERRGGGGVEAACPFHASSALFLQRKHLLRKLQIHMLGPPRVEEQIPIRRRLLNHPCMQIIPLCPATLIVRPRVDIPREPGLLFRVHAAELVKREGRGDGANGDVEAFLYVCERCR